MKLHPEGDVLSYGLMLGAHRPWGGVGCDTPSIGRLELSGLDTLVFGSRDKRCASTGIEPLRDLSW